jgi:Na+/H+ antiporter NhaA
LARPIGFSGRTAWVRRVETPLREFLRTESGGAAVILAAAVAALAWVNVDASSYEKLWETSLAISIGDNGIRLPLREWVNSGLMTFFFFVLGLEARREFDRGELRERRRVALPVLAAIGGMACAIAIYLAFNLGSSTASGWGIAMSTDTALALGFLSLAGRRVPERLRAFILTLVVVDDLLALVVIATAYTEDLELGALLWAAGFYAAVLAARAAGIRNGLVYFVLGVAAWVALLESGVEAVVLGLAMGLLVWAYPVRQSQLEQAGERFREFREQPTPELERSARESLRTAIPPNERLLHLYHPWTSYVIVPLFAFANAGIAIDAGLLERAIGSPVTLGIAFGYVIGKPLGIVGVSLLVTRLSRRRLRPPVGWAAVLGAGTIAGVGFTVSLLVATLAFDGARLEEAKVGILAAAAGAAALTWLVFRVTSLLPWERRIEALLGGDEPLIDLAYDVDPERDHIRGPLEAPVTVVEYGDFECPYCGRAEPQVRALLRDFADVRYVWRHLPLSDVHPNARLAAEASEAAAAQGAFWPMHDRLLEHQDALQPSDLMRHAEQLELDVGRFAYELRTRAAAPRIAEDVEGAELSGVSGTPTFFINGRRHYGAYDIDTLSRAVRAAGARARMTRTV